MLGLDLAGRHFPAAVGAEPEPWVGVAATCATETQLREAREAVHHALRLDPRNAEAPQMRRLLPGTAVTRRVAGVCWIGPARIACGPGDIHACMAVETGAETEANQPGPGAVAEQKWLLPFLGMACAVGVASIYYNQPLLLVMGRSLHASAQQMMLVATATQVGYAAGMLSFVPLGDIAERRGLMMRLYGAAAAALVLVALAQSLLWMIAASVLLGLFASVTHVALPLAPDLVPHERRGHAIGIVMTGLLLGILLARTFAGWVSNLGGWRTVFVVAAVMNAAFVPLMLRVMPRLEPKERLRYGEAMRSLWTIFRREPLLRESGVIGGLTFAAFSCFWTTLAFVLHADYGLGPGVAGTFGVVGAAGALVAPLAGRLADRHGTRYVITIAGAVVTGSFGWLWAQEKVHGSVAMHVAAMVVGVIALDGGTQMMQVANQTRIFGLDPAARSRLNTIYMTIYFVGGALGSALSSLVWERYAWTGVCGLAAGLMICTGLVHAFGASRRAADVRLGGVSAHELG